MQLHQFVDIGQINSGVRFYWAVSTTDLSILGFDVCKVGFQWAFNPLEHLKDGFKLVKM